MFRLLALLANVLPAVATIAGVVRDTASYIACRIRGKKECPDPEHDHDEED